MQRVAVVGAGDLGATLARRLAERGLARRVVLVDEDEGRARGKALDLMQSGPVEGYDVTIEGAAALDPQARYEAVLVADPAEEPDNAAAGRARAIASMLGGSPEAVLLAAGNRPGALLGALDSLGVPRDRLLGSAPLALAGALRSHLAAALETTAREVSLVLLGSAPDLLVVPRGSVSISGVPVDHLSPVALRRALGAVGARTLGPVALAAAAVRVLAALSGTRAAVLPVAVRLEGEYGHRGPVLAVPARLAAGRVQSVVEIPLEPVERVALDNAAGRSVAGAERRGFRD